MHTLAVCPQCRVLTTYMAHPSVHGCHLLTMLKFDLVYHQTHVVTKSRMVKGTDEFTLTCTVYNLWRLQRPL